MTQQGKFDWLPGHLAIDLKSNSGIDAQYRRHDEPFSEGFDMHGVLELGIVLSGRMTRCYRDFEIELGPGGVWLCGIWEPHGFRIGGEGAVEVALLVIDFELLQRFSGEKFDLLSPYLLPPSGRPQPKPERRDEVIRLGGMIAGAAERRDCWEPLRLQGFLLELLAILLENMGEGVSGGRSGSISLDRLMERMVRMRGNLSVAEAAEYCGVNERRFGVEFRALTGMPFHLFALRHRLAGATAELRRGATLDEIAGRWGFTDKSHFSRRFAEHYGMTPGEYRRRD
ncbi:MAG: helix-turn-helix domain-containing protein [Victivallaceae bacterium]